MAAWRNLGSPAVNSGQIYAIAADSGGRVYALVPEGGAGANSLPTPQLIRLSAAGVPDTDFTRRSPGEATGGTAYALRVLDSGEIVTAVASYGPDGPPGEVSPGVAGSTVRITRYDPDGSAVGATRFVPGVVRQRGLAISRTGQVTVAATQLSRFLVDGTPDPSFNGGQSVSPSAPATRLDSIAVSPDGSVTAIGSGGGAGGSFATISLFASDGKPLASKRVPGNLIPLFAVAQEDPAGLNSTYVNSTYVNSTYVVVSRSLRGSDVISPPPNTVDSPAGAAIPSLVPPPVLLGVDVITSVTSDASLEELTGPFAGELGTVYSHISDVAVTNNQALIGGSVLRDYGPRLPNTPERDAGASFDGRRGVE